MKSAVRDETYWRELFPDFNDEQIALLVTVHKEDNDDLDDPKLTNSIQSVLSNYSDDTSTTKDNDDLDNSKLTNSIQSVLSNYSDDATSTEDSIIIGTGENYNQSKLLLTAIQNNLHLFSSRLLNQIKTELTTLLHEQDDLIFFTEDMDTIPELLKTLDCYRLDTLHYLQDVHNHIIPAQQHYYLWQVIKEAKKCYDKANPVSIFESVSTLFRNNERERVSELYQLSRQSADYESMLNGLIQFFQGTLPGDTRRGALSSIDTHSHTTFVFFFIGEIIKPNNQIIKNDITQKIQQASDTTVLKHFNFWPSYTAPTKPTQIGRFIQGMQCLANKGVAEKITADDDYCILDRK